MNPKIKINFDPNSLEPSWIKVRHESPFSDEEIKKLDEWGATVHYDNGTFALVTLLPSRFDELAQLESVLEIL
jgi:hypothetical protein